MALELIGWSVPTRARFALYTTNLGNPSFMFNTNSATGCQITTWPSGGINRDTHGHGWCAFSATVTYTLMRIG